MPKEKIILFWHRRDLRVEDNCGLYEALQQNLPVLPVFIFDENILSELEDKSDPRVNFIYHRVVNIKEAYEKTGSSLLMIKGKPSNVFKQLIQSYNVHAVYTNKDYEPYAINRDENIRQLLKQNGISFHSFKDHVIYEESEVVKDNGEPYVVFTPYMKRWKEKFMQNNCKPYPSEKNFKNLLSIKSIKTLSLKEIGFNTSKITIPAANIDSKTIKEYADNRNFPSKEGTTRTSVHLRFGTISIRALVIKAFKNSGTYLNELIWREFYQMVLFHFPHIVNKSFKPAYDYIQWENNESLFQAWCEGKTGYPLVDAGMRELNATGLMHNRTRMVTASFLTKHLLIDWRWGEAYFAEKLLDYEMASNVGGWQWAAGCGCDAAPYFRVFNPILQTERFDPDKIYIKKWVPEYQTEEYPSPVIEHTFARNRVLEVYKKALNNYA